MTILLVANDGGHIMQLYTLRSRLRLGEDPVVWVTPRTPQTESLLRGQEVVWVPPSPTRDVMALLRNTRRIHSILRDREVSMVVSTGAALALAALPQARLRGIDAVYIESATRVVSPSLSGRILALTPGVRTFSQARGLSARRWRFLASPWDMYERLPDVEREVRSVVVCLGTSPFGFRRLVERLVAILPPDVEVLWQTGVTHVSGLGITARREVPSAELRAAIAACDVVITHAGTGSVLTALELGRTPVIVPRRSAFDEHVDDHQLEIARDVGTRGLAVVREAEQLQEADLRRAAAGGVRRLESEPTLDLAAEPQVAGWSACVPRKARPRS